MLATMYYFYSASMMLEMAQAVGKKEDAQKLEIIVNKIQKAFDAHYTDGKGNFITYAAAYGNGKGYVDGEMGFDGHTQTAYANAIHMNLVLSKWREQAGKNLVELIKKNEGKLSTGFLGVKPLLPALSSTGHTETAYDLLLSTEYPSWGFEVVNGANTIWERWNSYIKGKGFENNAGMNSFNHYAFGSVNEWLFGNAAGIKVKDAGFKTFIIKPEIAKKGINYINATYHSINGLIKSSWKKENNHLTFDVTIPVNTIADVYIPCKNEEAVKENDKSVVQNGNFKILNYNDGYLHIALRSGNYSFTSTL